MLNSSNTTLVPFRLLSDAGGMLNLLSKLGGLYTDIKKDVNPGGALPYGSPCNY